MKRVCQILTHKGMTNLPAVPSGRQVANLPCRPAGRQAACVTYKN